MHFWIDKRSSQLHQYGGGRRGPAGAGGFYSQNFGTHRNSHHPPPPSIVHHHPHRLRIRSNNPTPTTGTTSTSSAGAASSSGGGTSGANNINIHTLSSTNNSANNNVSQTGMPIANGNPPNSSSSIALQYPHQQPHQVQQQGAVMSPVSAAYGVNGLGGNLMTSISGAGAANAIRLFSGVRNSDRVPFRSTNNVSYNHALQQQSPQILAISGNSNGAINVAALNPPMAIVAADDEGGTLSSTTVLTFPPSATAAAAAANSTYSRDNPLAGTNIATTSRGSRGGRRTSSSSSSGIGRSSIGTAPGTTNGIPLSHSQNLTTPEGMTDRSTRSERTSFDRDTVTPQRSLSLTSPEAGEQSSRGTSTGGRPSLENEPGWACTKRVGLTLCFLAFILLGTVGAKFMKQGPEVLDGTRTGKPEAAAYFLFTELVFVVFAMFLFFTGVACLRKRTNDYLLRQFNQYILNSSAGTGGVTGGQMGIPGQDAYDFEYYDGAHAPGVDGDGRAHHHNHLHHNLHQGGFHHYRHHRSSGSLIEEGGDFGSITDLSHSPHNFHGAGPYHYPAHYGNGGGGGGGGGSSRSHGRSKPPPYDIAILLPLPDPEGFVENISPTQENSNINNDSHLLDSTKSNGKLTGSSDGIRFIDSSSVKDAQDAAGGNNVNYSSGSSENPVADSISANSGGGGGGSSEGGVRATGSGEGEQRSETPPPPYEQI